MFLGKIKQLQAQIKSTSKRQLEIEQKKSIYYQGLESGKLSMDLVADRLQELKQEEDQLNKVRLEAEERFLQLPDTQTYNLTQKEYTDLQQRLEAFFTEAPARQKHQFLSKFIKSVTVYPDKLKIHFIPPIFEEKKSSNQPQSGGRSFSVIELASPTGFEPVSLA